ncbi:MAG: phosphatidylserine decarboxylase [Pseudomonadota bacterium]|nr:MAG: phosphatidylserine decarboxylase [Pseudomonadota bacterium]
MRDILFVLMQYLLPHHALSRLMGYVARSNLPWVKNPLIHWFVRRYGVDMSEAVQSDPSRYANFNSFFTRALKPGARPLADGGGVVTCPVDGTVSAAGMLQRDAVLQAKGHSYSLAALLGGEQHTANFVDGSFATLYLSPRDYHRIHMPLEGTLREMVHVPGRLFSVNPATVARVPGLFARNERVVTLFDTAHGPLAVILVGAMFVASIETVWQGVITPPTAGEVRSWQYPDSSAGALTLARGAELGRFSMGSTVILLFPAGSADLDAALTSGAQVRMGQALGRTVNAA